MQSMIRRLYDKYRRQIALAFMLVVFENVAYIAEPYVFGKAIDGLREARRIEEAVDSSITTITLRQVADSVRSHILDSVRTLDSLRHLDSLESRIERPSEKLPSFQRFRPVSSLFHLALWQQADTSTPPPPEQSIVLPHAEPDSVKKTLARKDSIRGRSARRRSLLGMKREAALDSLRRAISKHPPPSPRASGTHINKPIGFYLPREVGPFLPPLLPWVLLFVINSTLGAFRRIYDTRIYTKMFADLSSDVVARQLAQGEELSKVAARSSMAWHNIEFFQYNVPEFLEQLIAVGGAVIALGLFDWRLTVVGSILIVFVALGSRFYMRNVAKIQSRLHDKYEDEYNTFSTREPNKIKQYYSAIADLEIKLAERSTISYSVIRVFLLFMFLTTLYISIDLDRFTIGALYSIVAYVWSFVTATEYIPYLSEKWVALKDASRRITFT